MNLFGKNKKVKIVERLLKANQITVEEASILLVSVQNVHNTIGSGSSQSHIDIGCDNNSQYTWHKP